MQITEAEFFADEDPKALEDGRNRCYDEGRDALQIAAPEFVGIETRETLPLLGYYAISFATARRIELQASAVVVAVCLETGEVRADLLLPVPPPPEGPFTEPGPPEEGMTGGSFRVDLFAQLDIPRRPGTWVVRVVARDLASNVVAVRVGGSQAVYQDPEAEKLIRETLSQRMPAIRPPQIPGKPLPRYRDVASPPPLPPGRDSALAVELARSVLLGHGATCLVTGRYRLKPGPREFIPPRKTAEPRPSAILCISLVLCGSKVAAPVVVRLGIPCYDPLRDGLAWGAFSIDLLSLPEVPRVGQTLFVYAVHGEKTVGPLPVALVPEKMVAIEGAV
jgi:hypothetical protein